MQSVVRRITASQKAPALGLSGRAAASDDMLSYFDNGFGDKLLYDYGPEFELLTGSRARW